MQVGRLRIVVAAAALLSGCDAPAGETPSPEPKDVSASQKPMAQAGPIFSRIDELTEQACRCKMAGRNTTKLELKLEGLSDSLKKDRWITSSVPLQADMTCYPKLGERACAGRFVLQKSPTTNFVCSGTEADELMAVWEAAATDDGGPDSFNKTLPIRDAALLKRLRAMHAEAAATIPQSACN